MYRLIWVTDIGFAGMDDREYPTAKEAMEAVAHEVIWKQRGREWQSNRSQYGDIFYVKPVGR
jgi:hypothetical protein